MCGPGNNCEQPEKLKTTPEECTPEQNCECHDTPVVKVEENCGCNCCCENKE